MKVFGELESRVESMHVICDCFNTKQSSDVCPRSSDEKGNLRIAPPSTAV